MQVPVPVLVMMGMQSAGKTSFIESGQWYGGKPDPSKSCVGLLSSRVLVHYPQESPQSPTLFWGFGLEQDDTCGTNPLRDVDVGDRGRTSELTHQQEHHDPRSLKPNIPQEFLRCLGLRIPDEF